ncbi:MAG TPA: DUF4386 domain-containing protein [Jatrophihabitans sp.]|jgi:hypothetical protein|uniref:DUF4386 domain-containing protein n=1 Tax=Jatrophihabitans sp. TaxID=1932789 RepID=UPI002E0C40C8|nr:DUF4386 domain-containing protein [Jatrophihabitans sp.]
MISTRPTTRPRMDPTRRISLTAGLLYLLTFAASIPQLALFSDAIDHRDFIRTAGGNGALQLGSLLEIVTAFAGVGTALALYPVTRRVSRTAALGFVTSRVIEGTMIMVGVMSMLALATLRVDYAGATGAQGDAVGVVGHALVTLRQWTFLLGPGIMPGVNALFLGTILYRSRLVPRLIPAVGLIGAPLILMSASATIFGGWGQVSTTGALCALPIATWEFALGVWLTVKGFRPGPLAALPAVSTVTREPVPVG